MDTKVEKDIKVLAKFISLYCKREHKTLPHINVHSCGIVGEAIQKYKPYLCATCAKVLLHGVAKRLMCPYDPKPRCKKCKTPCYAPFYREQIKRIMRSSGLAYILRGRLDLLWKYLF